MKYAKNTIPNVNVLIFFLLVYMFFDSLMFKLNPILCKKNIKNLIKFLLMI